MRSVRLIFVLPFCLSIGIMHHWASSVSAENTSMENGRQIQWFNAGLGVSSFGTARGGSFSYPSGKGLVSIRYVYNFMEIDPSPGYITSPSFNKNVWDAGVLFGKIAKASYGLASVSGGIGIVGGVRGQKDIRSTYDYFLVPYPVDNDKERFLTVGFPVEGQLFWTPLPNLGIGIYGFANLNAEESFAGALLGLQMGKIN